ncbi:FAD/NAD-binding domain-containing protein [Vararia minispora EC-137]|uniref:FAD/NAD-binding domain-containing protein n=1 Tax=Vararia minispora EC-137 TaxID=1314806 RepID=A0ACB8QH53_9AGAM|nr:FAD/NAD-binding domain-containing protein [Vararia minispora EC-137]
MSFFFKRRRNDAKSASQPDPDAAGAPYALPDFAVDEYRPLKVICIGAGYSGIIAGIRFSQRIAKLDLTIYEKENGIGGTWHVNRYPGLACDIPSHCYQLTFEEHVEWSNFYAPGPEIRAYLQRVVDKYKLMRYIKLRHELVGAAWDEVAGRWHVRIRRADDAGKTEEFEDECDVLFLGIGVLSRWKWPDVDGLKNFGGRVIHTAQWDAAEGEWQETVKDWGDKVVGLIGNGSSGIQAVTALQPRVKSLINFAKSKTWLSTSFSVNMLLKLLGRAEDSIDYDFTEEHWEKFKDPKYYKDFRHEVEHDLNSVNSITIRDSPLQKAAAAAFKAEMEKKLARKPELAEQIVPQFSVSCRRLTPGPGYLEALCEPNTSLERTPITRVTKTGVELADGRAVALDVLVCATGFDTSYHYPFPITGRGGLALNARWTPHAEAYLSVAVDGFPNLFWALGPNSGLNSGSLLVLMEKQVDYIVAAAAKMQRERIKAIEVKRAAVLAWRAYVASYFPKTVFTDACNSWYRTADGAIVGLWPGSCLHAVRALQNPRWEDFEYTYVDAGAGTGPLYWLGDGQSWNEKTMTGDRAWYLDEVDIPPVPED